MSIDRRLLLNIDWVLLGAVLLLSAIGVAMVWSATDVRDRHFRSLRRATQVEGSLASPVREAPPRPHRFSYAWRQTCWVALAGLIMGGTLFVDYRRLADRAPLLFLLAVAGLAAVLLFGPRIAGTRRWLELGSIRLQPSEFVKPVAALVIARIFAESRKDSLSIRDTLGPSLAIALLAGLVALEPDLGTAFCLVPLLLVVAFLAGLQLRVLVAGCALAALLGGLGWRYAPLETYQKRRIQTFLDPSLDPRGGGYQSIQSQIAVGSGRLLGQGYRKGSQSQYGYLPARHTDFVFSVLAEEMGFVGVLLVLGLYLVVFWRSLEAAHTARDRLGALLVAGVTVMLAFQVVYNVAMVAGLVPVKGLPLPFLSYGGSSLLSTYLSVALILNVRMRRFAN